MLDGRLKEYNNHYYVKKEELYKAPYHQDSKLLSSPCFNTTHIDTFKTHNRHKYSYIKSRYKNNNN